MPYHPIRPSGQRGFTYLWLLFLLAIGSVGLAGLGQRTRAIVQSERESELIFRGNEIAHALESYRDASAGEPKTLPKNLEDLVEDRRGATMARHLRRLYTDPFTGHADWLLHRAPDAGIAAVSSRSDVVLMRTADLPPARPASPWRASDRVFRAAAPARAASVPAPQPAD